MHVILPSAAPSHRSTNSMLCLSFLSPTSGKKMYGLWGSGRDPGPISLMVLARRARTPEGAKTRSAMGAMSEPTSPKHVVPDLRASRTPRAVPLTLCSCSMCSVKGAIVFSIHSISGTSCASPRRMLREVWMWASTNPGRTAFPLASMTRSAPLNLLSRSWVFPTAAILLPSTATAPSSIMPTPSPLMVRTNPCFTSISVNPAPTAS